MAGIQLKQAAQKEVQPVIHIHLLLQGKHFMHIGHRSHTGSTITLKAEQITETIAELLFDMVVKMKDNV